MNHPVLFRALKSLRHYPFRLAGWPLVVAGLAVLTAQNQNLHRLTALLATVATLCLTPLTGWWAVRWLTPALSTRGWVARRDDAAQHAGGVATFVDVGQVAGERAMRSRARTLRPSLRKVSWSQRQRTPTRSYAVPLIKTGWLPFGNMAWSSCSDTTVRVGGPQSGKSGSIACHILDAPGALLVTTSRTDLLDNTRHVRERLGRVIVFNPTGLGGLASSVRWSPLAGCADLGTAQRRAQDLIPTSTSGEGERWDNQARGLLAVLMHAAALSGGTLRTVLGWISPADAVARDQIREALQASPSSRALWAEIRSMYGTNERTLSSITAQMIPALRWLTDTSAASVGDAPLDDPNFLDVAQYVASGRDSLYLIGREGNCRTLIGALTAEVAHHVRMTAAAMPSGRLDPPMTAVLDEAPLTCGPIPLHDWTADMGGRGWTLHIAAQSLSQLRDVWGHDRANTILGNTSSLLVFGGLKAADDLERISTLCGTRLMQLDSDDRRPVPVMTPGDIAALPVGTALLIRTGTRPVIGRAPMIWDRSVARRARAASQRFTALRPVDTAPVAPEPALPASPPAAGTGHIPAPRPGQRPAPSTERHLRAVNDPADPQRPGGGPRRVPRQSRPPAVDTGDGTTGSDHGEAS